MGTSKDADIERAKKLLCETLMSRYQLNVVSINQKLVNDIEKAINAALTLGIAIGEALPR